MKETVSILNSDQSSTKDQSPKTQSTRETNRWAGTHNDYGFVQFDAIQKWTLQDNQSIVTVFPNTGLVDNRYFTRLRKWRNGGHKIDM
jgi:hypothetical protein